MNWNDVLHFWFVEHGPHDWFAKSDTFDREICARFFDVHRLVSEGETTEWQTSIYGRLAEIIVLDQFSRNMFRGTPQAFSFDSAALARAREALRMADAQLLTPRERHMLLMPFMHSESPEAHKEALQLFTELGNPDALAYETRHKRIIDTFGRYPHRNSVLGRASTPAEEEFLKTNPGF